MTRTESLIDLNLVLQKHPAAPAVDRPLIDIVVLAGSASVADGIRPAAERNGWRIHPCATLNDAVPALANLSISAVLCESRIGDASWRDVLAYLQKRHPGTVLIVVIRFADVRLWLDVLEAGGHDVLLFPFEDGELAHALSPARRPLRVYSATA